MGQEGGVLAGEGVEDGDEFLIQGAQVGEACRTIAREVQAAGPLVGDFGEVADCLGGVHGGGVAADEQPGAGDEAPSRGGGQGGDGGPRGDWQVVAGVVEPGEAA